MSISTNPTERPSLESDSFDVLVIGGGISGVAIARECARGGKRTLLVEQTDFAAGTTSRSTRIIHGGLRYLEHGDIVQVRESLRERGRLLRQYPHQVRPLRFLLALDEHSRRSSLAVRTGLWLYRTLGGATTGETELESSQAKLERMLDRGRRFSVFSFDDAQCEFPERLVAQWLVEAAEAGCVARNHTQLIGVEVRDRAVTGARLRDEFSGRETRVGATWIINAAGPWADRVCQVSAIDTQIPMVGGVRGSHIVLPKVAGMPEAALYTEAVDGRPVFVVPWNGQLLVGTTEVPDAADPGRVQPTGQEIDYLFRSFRQLFPESGVSAEDIRCAFAGVRPLPHSTGADVAALSRKHHLHDHADDGARGMLSVIGGKLTTAGWVARECAAKIGVRIPTRVGTTLRPEGGVDELLNHWVTQTAEAGGTSLDTARGLVEWFGGRSVEIVEDVRDRRELLAPLCPHTHHIVAEARHAFAREHALTLSDVLLRRVPVALGACWSEQCSRVAADRIAEALGWDSRRRGTELERFEAEYHAFLQRPAAVRQ